MEATSHLKLNGIRTFLLSDKQKLASLLAKKTEIHGLQTTNDIPSVDSGHISYFRE